MSSSRREPCGLREVCCARDKPPRRPQRVRQRLRRRCSRNHPCPRPLRRHKRAQRLHRSALLPSNLMRNPCQRPMQPTPHCSSTCRTLRFPAPRIRRAHAAESDPSKQYPWQPRKPLAEPMASALRRAAEAAGKSEFDAAAPRPTAASQAADSAAAVPQTTLSQSGIAATGFAQTRSGAAAAPARAKEIPAPDAKKLGLEPTASAIAAPSHQKRQKSRGSKIRPRAMAGIRTRRQSPPEAPLSLRSMTTHRLPTPAAARRPC